MRAPLGQIRDRKMNEAVLQVNGRAAKSTDPASWTFSPEVRATYKGVESFDGI